jgi:hypothetical protein
LGAGRRLKQASRTALFGILFLAASTPAMLALRAGAAAEEKPAADSCSLRYGTLMTDHWLIVDLARQIERGLFYLHGRVSPGSLEEFETLQLSLSATERELGVAVDLYRSLVTSNSLERGPQLASLLNRIETEESGNRITATELLQGLGKQAAQGSFEALPVSEEALAPAWLSASNPPAVAGKPNKLLDRDYRPRRILFGSTGKAGDDRTLPLRFDFGSGIFGFYVPMAASNKLDIAKGFADRSDAAFRWMQANRSGYHYWAGVYNNQNTYVAPWFLKEHGDESDIWMKLADGRVLKGGEWAQVNIWNPGVRRYIQDYCSAQARTLRDDPFLVCYDYTGEPHPWGGLPPGQPQYSGYNDSAIVAFQKYLREKFGRIRKLNQAWRTNFSDFTAIQQPPDPYLTSGSKATPLNYEFERFRCDSHARYWKMVYDAYRKHDKDKPIEANAGMFMSGWPVEGLDAYQLQKTGVADWVDMHMNNFPPNLPEQIYLYSLCRLTGKVPVEFEYVWTFPRTGPVGETNESDFRATCEASVWRNLVWGKKVLVFFDFYYDWPAYHNAFFDPSLGYSILRPSACVVPVMKRKALRFNDILMETEVAAPPIIVLEPTTSILNSTPLHPNQSFSYHTGVAARDVHELLFPKNYPFLYVPEQAVLDGYSLDKHQVIILPQAPCFPAGLTECLLAWVKRGGTLISIGVPGIWDPYGHDDGRLVNQVFGPSQVRDDQPGKWKWDWQLEHPLPAAVWTTNDSSGSVLASLAIFGKGRVLVSSGPFDGPDLRERFYQVLDSAIGQKPAACEHDLFELVLREDRRGHRFLFVLNPHTRELREGEVVIAGSFSHCLDLGIGSGLPVPTSVTGAETRLRLLLHPGEGTVISLER